MRILHVINHTGRYNGNVHAAVDLACAEADAGHRVAVCHGGGDFDAVLREHGVEVFIIQQRRRLVPLLRSVVATMSLLRRWKPDVVHAHMVASLLIALPACKLRRTPVVATVHNAFERTSIAMGLAQRVVAVSASVGVALHRRGIPSPRIAVILNGTIGTPRRGGKPAVPTLQRPAILFLGGLHPRKGLVDLLAAFEQVQAGEPPAHLYVVGEGPMEAEYRAIAAGLACGDRVTFCGACPEPFGHLLAADLLVLPSLADPAPLVLSEAREAGCAIIATNVDGIPEMLEFGGAGQLVNPNAPGEIAEAIRAVLSDDLSLATWRRRSKAGSHHLSLARVATQTLALYEECLTEATGMRSDLRTAMWFAARVALGLRPRGGDPSRGAGASRMARIAGGKQAVAEDRAAS